MWQICSKTLDTRQFINSTFSWLTTALSQGPIAPNNLVFNSFFIFITKICGSFSYFRAIYLQSSPFPSYWVDELWRCRKDGPHSHQGHFVHIKMTDGLFPLAPHHLFCCFPPKDLWEKADENNLHARDRTRMKIGCGKKLWDGGDDASQRQDAWYPKQMIQQLECKPSTS